MRVLALLLVLCCAVSVIEARRKPPPPIRGHNQDPRFRRRHRKSSVCHFGKQTYELDAMWNPDLGSPFGVMYCVQCECVPIQRKRRVVGRVKCRNIKRDCPKPNCKNPVLPVGECCKTCDDGVGGRSRADLVDEDDEPTGKEFAVLMTGLTSRPTLSQAVASGRFRLKRRTLTYSFYYERMQRPKKIVFFDSDMNIVEEMVVSRTDYEIRSNKICGLWKKVPRRYRRKLKRGDLHVGFSLVEVDAGGDADDVSLEISGQILRYKGLQTEKFSALLTPEVTSEPLGAGGTAIVSLASRTGGFHLTLVTRGVWGPEDTVDGQLVVQMGANDNDKMTLDEVINVSSIEDDETIVEATTSLIPPEMRQLARGRMKVKVFSRKHPERRLTGVIMPEIGCNTFSALLSGVDSSESPPPQTTGSGLATLRLWNDGSLEYAIRIQDVFSTILKITIEKSGKRNYEVEDVLPQYLNGWANGTLNRLHARDVEALLDENLYISVETERYKSELAGRINRLTVSQAHQADFPIMLTSRNSSSAGLVWMAVDDNCALHYDVQVADRTAGNRRIELVEFPGRQRRERILAEFGGARSESRINNLPKTTMLRMEKGETIVKVVPLRGDDEISSDHAKVLVPQSCLPRRRINVNGYFHDQNEYEENEIKANYDCVYEDQVYEDGAQWDAQHDKCKICGCNHGKVVCEPIVCPPLSCKSNVTHPVTCCPVCSDVPLPEEVNETTRGCLFAGKFWPGGTTWHPFMPPSGYNKCVICTCQANGTDGEYRVSCARSVCPELDCPGREYRPREDSCCPECRPEVPPQPQAAVSPQAAAHSCQTTECLMQDEDREFTEEEILQAGGCKKGKNLRRNGENWHPRLVTIGLLPCVNCNCRNGQVSCWREHCPRLTCTFKLRQRDTCCPVCAEEKGRRRRRRRQPDPL